MIAFSDGWEILTQIEGQLKGRFGEASPMTLVHI
jgi:hypothetical protein